MEALNQHVTFQKKVICYECLWYWTRWQRK